MSLSGGEKARNGDGQVEETSHVSFQACFEQFPSPKVAFAHDGLDTRRQDQQQQQLKQGRNCGEFECSSRGKMRRESCGSLVQDCVQDAPPAVKMLIVVDDAGGLLSESLDSGCDGVRTCESTSLAELAESEAGDSGCNVDEYADSATSSAPSSNNGTMLANCGNHSDHLHTDCSRLSEEVVPSTFQSMEARNVSEYFEQSLELISCLKSTINITESSESEMTKADKPRVEQNIDSVLNSCGGNHTAEFYDLDSIDLQTPSRKKQRRKYRGEEKQKLLAAKEKLKGIAARSSVYGYEKDSQPLQEETCSANGRRSHQAADGLSQVALCMERIIMDLNVDQQHSSGGYGSTHDQHSFDHVYEEIVDRFPWLVTDPGLNGVPPPPLPPQRYEVTDDDQTTCGPLFRSEALTKLRDLRRYIQSVVENGKKKRSPPDEGTEEMRECVVVNWKAAKSSTLPSGSAKQQELTHPQDNAVKHASLSRPMPFTRSRSCTLHERERSKTRSKSKGHQEGSRLSNDSVRNPTDHADFSSMTGSLDWAESSGVRSTKV